MRALFLLPVVMAAWSQSPDGLRREGGYWVERRAGSVEAALPRLKVVTRGHVTVRGAERTGYSWVCTRRAGARDAEKARRALAQPEIQSKAEKGWSVLTFLPPPGQGSVDVVLQVPRALRETAVFTQGGGLDIHGLDGDVSANTAGGRVRMDGIGGDANVRTGGGEIRLGSVGGSVRCASAGGSIRVASAGREAVFLTAGGEIYVGRAEAPVRASTGGGNIHIEAATANVVAQTAGGVIEVGRASGLVIAETGGGAIQIGGAGGVRCRAASGPIRLRDVSGALRAATASGNIFADLAAGTRLADSVLDSASGDITVLIPSNVAVTVRARNESGPKGSIVSEFSEIRIIRSRADQLDPVLAEGVLNGGGPVLSIAASGGSIFLRRRD